MPMSRRTFCFKALPIAVASAAGATIAITKGQEISKYFNDLFNPKEKKDSRPYPHEEYDTESLIVGNVVFEDLKILSDDKEPYSAGTHYLGEYTLKIFGHTFYDAWGENITEANKANDKYRLLADMHNMNIKFFGGYDVLADGKIIKFGMDYLDEEFIIDMSILEDKINGVPFFDRSDMSSDENFKGDGILVAAFTETIEEKDNWFGIKIIMHNENKSLKYKYNELYNDLFKYRPLGGYYKAGVW